MPDICISSWNLAMTAWFFVLGASVGSFLNVCIYRMPRDKSICNPSRSFCPTCGHGLAWYDNIPILSFFLLGRRCRHCGGKISARYAVVEALTAAVFALLYLRYASWQSASWGVLLGYAVLTAALIASLFIDAEFFIIPDAITLPVATAGVIWCGFFPELQTVPGFGNYPSIARGLALEGWQPNLAGLAGSAFSALLSALIVYVLRQIGTAIFHREAMGMGDVKLMAMVGAFLGWKLALVAFFLAPFFGVLAGIPQLLTKKQHEMPYGPHLALATVVAMLCQNYLLERFVYYSNVLLQALGMLTGSG